MPLVVLSAKVQPETLAQWNTAKENSEAMTANAFVEEVLEAYLNPKIKEIEVAPAGWISPEEHAAAIQLKDNEIGQLKTGQTLTEENQAEQIRILNEQNDTLLEQVTKLKNHTVEQNEPGENQLLIDVNPFVLFALNDEIEAQRKAGTELTPSVLLCSYFLQMKKNGRVFAARIWSDSEFKNLQKKYLTPAE